MGNGGSPWPVTALSASPSSHFFPVVVWILSMGCSSYQENLLQHRLLSSDHSVLQGTATCPTRVPPQPAGVISAPAPGAPHPSALTWVLTQIFSPLFSTVHPFSPLLRRGIPSSPDRLCCALWWRLGPSMSSTGQLWVSVPLPAAPYTVLSVRNFSQIMGFKARRNPMEKANRFLNDLIKKK